MPTVEPEVDSASTPGLAPLCLVTGVTGYVGGRLVPELLAAGYRVRVFARNPQRLRSATWINDVEVVAGDAGDPLRVKQAMAGVDTCYFLLHSMQGRSGFSSQEASLAQISGECARDAGVAKIVYLGGINPATPREDLSEHLRSRAEVGEILRASGVPTVELRAAVIIGSGSASFEMLRYLTERLPVMVTPKWIENRVQPISIRDVLRYLVATAGADFSSSRVFDIGGPDVVTYRQMMQHYASIAGLRKRVVIGVPVLTPKLSSHWVGLVTPVPRSIARPLVDSLRHEVVCTHTDSQNELGMDPATLLGLDDALKFALRRVREANVSTRWSDASVLGAPFEPLPLDPDWTGGSLYRDIREADIPARRSDVWSVLDAIGGDNGWYSFPLAWEVRGALDRVVGGVGLRRGRRDPAHLAINDAVDFWRVEERIEGKLLRLRAEMKLPGLAWLEFSLTDGIDGQTHYRQRAIFHPRGLAGHAYWWSVAPFHGFVFGSMVRNITRAAAARASEPRPLELVSSELVS